MFKTSPATCAVSKPLEISRVFVRFGLSIPAGAMCGGVAGATCRKIRCIYRCVAYVSSCWRMNFLYQFFAPCIFCISFLPLNPISSKGEPKSHEVCLLVAQLVVRLVVPVAFASTNTEPVAEVGLHHFSATKFGHNFHATLMVISGSDQRWHRSSESEGAVCSCESFVF